jgi:hypothetical protein
MKKTIVTGGNSMVGRNLRPDLPNAEYFSKRQFDLTNELENIILQLVRVCIGIAALAFLIIFAIKFYAKSKGLEKSNEKATKSNNVGLVKQ